MPGVAEHVLDQGELIYRPFTRAESKQLRGFVDRARRLGHASLWKQTPRQVTIEFRPETGLTSEMDAPDEEALEAAIARFRHVYNHNEPYSYKKAMNLLKRSVNDRGGDLRDAAIEALDAHMATERAIMRGETTFGYVLKAPDGTTRDIDPPTIFEAYFHGRYLHDGNEKSELANALEHGAPLTRYMLYTVMLELRNVYWQGANVVDRVLRVPDLLDAHA
jgi:hypothetical protein